MKKIFRSAILLFAVLAFPASAARDYTKQPFTSNSPWNYPIGSGAIYKSVPGLNSQSISINYADKYTTGVYAGKESDRVGRLYFRGGKMWTDLHNKYIIIDGKSYPFSNVGNDPIVDDYLRGVSSTTPQFDANYYSCVKPGCTTYSWPTSFHRATDPYYSATFNIPNGAVPSPDDDGHIAIFQPNGWVLEAYNAVVLANGDIACGLASYTNAFDEGTGWSSGRKASMLPNFGGLIRGGEITAGDIPHAMVVLMNKALMKEEASWPAYAWDTNSGYGNCADCMPMGALMAIPANVDINSLGLTAKGKVVARAAQDYGMYVADRGGGGITLQAEPNATDYRWTGDSNDLKIIVNKLQWVSNNSSTNRGGGGTLRRPLAAELTPIGGETPPTSPQSPYPGPTPAVVPGKIEAENFDSGGEGVSYHDTNVGNSGGAYRTSEDVDLQSTTDTGGGYNVGWVKPGEWLEYTINAPTAGNYDISARVAAASGYGGTFHIEFNGANKTGAMTAPATGGWQSFTNVTKANVSLPAGEQVMKVVFDSAVNTADQYLANFNYFQVTASTPVILGDLNGDGSVNSTDFGIIKSDFLKLTASLTNPKSDIDGDGQCTVKDVGIMMSNWK